MFGTVLKAALADHEKQEDLVMQSPLDWTIVRPGAFTEGDRTDAYQQRFSPASRDITLKISTANVADFMLQQLTDDTYLRKTPGLSH